MFSTDFQPSKSAIARRDSDPDASASGQLVFHRQRIIVWSALGVVIALAVLCAALIAEEQRKIRIAAAMVISKPLERAAEINAAFQELHALDTQPCSAMHLAALRSIAFRSAVIRDVTYQGESAGLRCSGNLGPAASTLPSKSPDFTTETGRRIWRNIDLPLSPGVKSTLVKEGGYDLLIAPEKQPVTVQNGYYALSVVLLNRASSTMLVVRGTDPGIAQPLFVSGSTYWLRGDLISVACLPGQITCYVLKAHGLDVLMSNLILLCFTGFLAAVCTAIGVASWRALKFRKRTIDALLREAVEKKELFMHYQPIVDNRTGETVSAEALMRWTLRSGESVSPVVFIPIAEANDLIGQLTRLALQRVSEDFGAFLRTHPHFKISVNVVPADMEDIEFHLSLQRYFEEQGIVPTQLAFELTERTSAKLDSAVTFMLELRGRGYEICIDDFGTGYANLSYLSDLKVDKIKLDKKFTDTVGTGTLREKIVPAVIELAKELGVQIIVEGVENEEQVKYFRDRGVHLMQGWFYRRPQSAAELIYILETTRSWGKNRLQRPANMRVDDVPAEQGSQPQQCRAWHSDPQPAVEAIGN
ncbi:EAL domain-containing protein [Variovorax sp. RB2P76]|uniref:EAL domain-containing protein n=1 Tax=Variovorax sp. RB2P76 TaxID=3443736 RepID=UPI003F4873F9